MDEAGIYAQESPYLERVVQIGVAGGRVISVSFPDEPDPEASDDHEILERIVAYLEGVEDDFADLEVGLTVPTDQRKVLEATRKIPYGEQVSAETLARMAGVFDPEEDPDLTIVRTALDENPIPLVVPDHRVRDGPSAAPPAVEQRLRSLEGL